MLGSIHPEWRLVSIENKECGRFPWVAPQSLPGEILPLFDFGETFSGNPGLRDE
jgi:hypothetical protein